MSLSPFNLSRTPNHPLRPEAPAAGGVRIAETILLIGLGKFASSAGSAKGEVEGLDPLAKGNIFGVRPQILEIPIQDVS
jgi:hypothetical protein